MTTYYRGLIIEATNDDGDTIAVRKDDNYYTSAETAAQVLGTLYGGIDSSDTVSDS